jgi:hypothetical protein
MDEARFNEITRLLFRWVFPRPPEEWNTEDDMLDAMEFVILAVASNVEETAKWRAPKLARNPDAWAEWVEMSKYDLVVWHTVRLAAKEVWEVEPDALRGSPLEEWAVEAGLGIRCKPSTPPGPDPWKRLVRDAAIVDTIGRIVALGRRKATYPTDGGSACHKVAERFRSGPRDFGVRVPTSYEGVRKIWHDRLKAKS